VVSGRVKEVRVVVINCREDGRLAMFGRHHLESVVGVVEELSSSPDIVCLPSTTGLGLHDSSALLSLTAMLSELLPDGDCFYPLTGVRAKATNPPALWVSIRQISATVDRHPGYPGEAQPSYPIHHHLVETSIAGNLVWLKPVRWPVRYPGWLNAARGQVATDANLAAVPAMLLGDFATTLDSARSDQAWFHYGHNTEEFRMLLQTGFWDAGQVAAEYEPDDTANAERVTDHILVSRVTPARLLTGSFHIGPDWARPHYTGVACTLEFEDRSRRNTHARQSAKRTVSGTSNDQPIEEHPNSATAVDGGISGPPHRATSDTR
jgi:hypothetical protein